VSSVQRIVRRDEKGGPPAPVPLLGGIVGRMETRSGLDREGAPLGAAWHRLLRPGPVVDALSGMVLGGPAHPALVWAPIGCWTGALVADLAGERRAGRVLTGLGVLSALPVAATGAADWADTTGAGVSLVVVRSEPDPAGGGGRPPRVLANRCSHRGGPLVDGEIHGDCLRCPRHGSEFDITTGQVRRGPATMAQPVYHARFHGGALQVRRDQPRSLRVNQVRP
jgi:Rieske [2Fe-2S] domain